MKLLIDANLSYKLADKLKPFFEECFHVDYIGLQVPARDIEIWNYAKENNLIIVTNDEYFLNLLNVKGFPPKIVLLRMGNQRTIFIADLLVTHLAEIEALNNDISLGALELY